MFLTLEIPPVPLFKKEKELIPHVNIYEMLKKFDGETITKKFSRLIENKDKFMGYKYRISQMPKYLIVHLQRF